MPSLARNAELDDEFGGIRNYLTLPRGLLLRPEGSVLHSRFKYHGRHRRLTTGSNVLGEEVPDYSEFCNRGK